MEYQVARLQDIVTKIQYFCKLNFKNSVDINILLDAEGLEIEDINRLISAGVKIVGFHTIEQLGVVEHLLLPCKRYYLGDLSTSNLSAVIAGFDVIESVTESGQVAMISDLNARTGKVCSIMVKMNILSTIKKFGFLPSEIDEQCYEMAKTSGIRLVGVNTYVPPLDNLKLRQTALRKAGTMYKMLAARFRGFDRFSLNFMSRFEDLVGEGVNEIRIGIKDLV